LGAVEEASLVLFQIDYPRLGHDHRTPESSNKPATGTFTDSTETRIVSSGVGTML